jgi:hypothetical protein
MPLDLLIRVYSNGHHIFPCDGDELAALLEKE